MTPGQRPLSPHLQVYKPEFTSASSIFHRITGVALAAGTILLVVWFVAAGVDGAAFNSMQSFWGTIIGQLLLGGWSFAFFYHLCNGIRHLFWSTGRGFDLSSARNSALIMLFASLFLTGAAWVWGFLLMEKI
ncbi:MAG: succinate dehydrogenase, cytochrome b556 subunit [Rhodospirillaceae bacterium]|nr:succinate dehydrogenase, cytochrome b556 subunit [Rhodospirillaceae bacterium]|tara:strand:- start:7540 stop:7935 length:396 start_codon:yes stop_codon:yes gene_type:complete